jgi:hypothetical protein
MTIMKKFKIKIAALLLASVAVGFAGCKKFLDINENPNAPSDANVALLLPTAEAAVAHVIGNQFQVYGGMWAQYWTQSSASSQFKSIDQYSANAANFDRSWRILYTNALQNFKVIIDKAATQPQYTQYAAISYIMKGYTFQVLADAFGDVPVNEATNTDITNPHYDPQATVYDSIFSFIDKGLALIDLTTEAVPASDDLIFQGDMEKWQQFANTLKLRAYLRIAKADPPKSEAGVRSLAGATFLSTDGLIEYSSTGGNQNPLFAEILDLGRTQNLVASSTVVDEMNRNNDPRVLVFYEIDTSLKKVVGIAQGAFDTITVQPKVSDPTIFVGAKGNDDRSATAPVKLISATESYFLQSEAVARGWLTGNAAQLFQSGITASFAAYDLNGEAANYLCRAPGAQWPDGNLETQLKASITQKYYAMCGNQGFEAWSERRRTGYPTFLKVSLASSLGTDQMPARLLYPSTEVTQNANFPGLQLITAPVWWDK